MTQDNRDLLKTATLAVLRHLLTAVGGIAFVKTHDNEIMSAAALLVAVIPAAFGAWKASRDHTIKEELKEVAVVAMDKADAAERKTEFIVKSIHADAQ